MLPLRTACLAFLASVSLSALSTAQYSSPPIPVGGPAFARTRTSLYIQGGNIDFRDPNPIRTGQFYRLDLSVPWNTSQPAWYKLKDGPVNAIFPAVFSLDEKTMITFHSGISTTFAYKYSVDSDTWSPSSLRVSNPDFQGINAVTDLSTGLVYVAAGYSSPYRDNMDVFDFAIDDIRSSKLPPSSQAFEARAYYTNVWSRFRKSILYFGGYNASLAPVSSAVVTEYVPSTQVWSTLTPTGTGPSIRADHCMAANDDGSKVIVYGGRMPNSNSGDIFILDLKTNSWTKGMAGPIRLYTTCTIAGDLFITWGGTDGTQTVGFGTTSQSPQVYNITADRWVTNYVPPASYVTPPSPGENGGETKSNVGAIVGGIVAAVVVVAGAAFFIFWRRRKSTKGKGKANGSDHSYSAVLNQDSYSNNNSGGPVPVCVAAPAPVPDAEAQIFHPSHNYQPPIIHALPVTPSSTSSSPYTEPMTPVSMQANYAPPPTPTSAPYQAPVKVMMAHTPEIRLPQEDFAGSSKDLSVDGRFGKPGEYPLSTIGASGLVSRPGNPQAILEYSASSRGNNPQAIVDPQQQQL
ncbi:hypothetical protein BGZ73_003971 [Actinomortierella ambigua]|nr:hypothetical protein BGZ73_003971 [Actinomortierella ambigua]